MICNKRVEETTISSVSFVRKNNSYITCVYSRVSDRDRVVPDGGSDVRPSPKSTSRPAHILQIRTRSRRRRFAGIGSVPSDDATTVPSVRYKRPRIQRGRTGAEIDGGVSCAAADVPTETHRATVRKQRRIRPNGQQR